MNKLIIAFLFMAACGHDAPVESELKENLMGLWQPLEGIGGEWTDWPRCSRGDQCIRENDPNRVGAWYPREEVELFGDDHLKMVRPNGGLWDFEFQYRSDQTIPLNVLQSLGDGEYSIEVDVDAAVVGAPNSFMLRTPGGGAFVEITLDCQTAGRKLFVYGNCNPSSNPNPYIPRDTRRHCDRYSNIGTSSWHFVESTLRFSNFKPSLCDKGLDIRISIRAKELSVGGAKWKIIDYTP